MSEKVDLLIELIKPIVYAYHGKETDNDREQAALLGTALVCEAESQDRIDEVIQFLKENPNVEYDDLEYFVYGPDAYEDE